MIGRIDEGADGKKRVKSQNAAATLPPPVDETQAQPSGWHVREFLSLIFGTEHAGSDLSSEEP